MMPSTSREYNRSLTGTAGYLTWDAQPCMIVRETKSLQAMACRGDGGGLETSTQSLLTDLYGMATKEDNESAVQIMLSEEESVL